MVRMGMVSLLPVFGSERCGRDGDALAAHIVENVDLVGEGAAGEDLEDLERLLQGGPRRLVRHQGLDGFALESHWGLPQKPVARGSTRKAPPIQEGDARRKRSGGRGSGAGGGKRGPGPELRRRPGA